MAVLLLHRDTVNQSQNRYNKQITVSILPFQPHMPQTEQDTKKNQNTGNKWARRLRPPRAFGVGKGEGSGGLNQTEQQQLKKKQNENRLFFPYLVILIGRFIFKWKC